MEFQVQLQAENTISSVQIVAFDVFLQYICSEFSFLPWFVINQRWSWKMAVHFLLCRCFFDTANFVLTKLLVTLSTIPTWALTYTYISIFTVEVSRSKDGFIYTGHLLNGTPAGVPCVPPTKMVWKSRVPFSYTCTMTLNIGLHCLSKSLTSPKRLQKASFEYEDVLRNA